MPRTDLSADLIHWIKGESDEEAFDVLRAIVGQQRLLGGDGHIKGGYQCVCFTEAPETTFHQVLGKYRPFGIRLSKNWVFCRGGRPVIYQPDHEYELLPESHRWRHVWYEPDRDPPIDFSWEREWRILVAQLPLLPGEAQIIVPHEDWGWALHNEHAADEAYRIEMEAVVYDEYWVRAADPFYYSFSVVNLSD